MKLLFIEDDATYFEWLKVHLDGHDAQMAHTIEEAETRMVKERFDAVFIDLNMPRYSSAELVARSRAALSGKTTPLIVLTGREMRCELAAICDGFIFKGGLNDPEHEIPAAVREFTRDRDEMHIYDRAAQLVNAVRSLAHYRKRELA